MDEFGQRWSRRALLLVGTGTLLAACTHSWAGNGLYSIGVRGEGNQVEIAPDGTADSTHYRLKIAGARGIGEATVAWWSNVAPSLLEFHLHLRGLEHFALRWAETSSTQRSVYTLLVSVNSSDTSIRQSLQVDGEIEMPLDAASPHWMEITLPTSTQESFVLMAPASFLRTAPRLWTVSWIDFYR
jgi:hypothetical protein